MGTVVGAWRLKTMVFCLIMLTCLYLVQGIFMSVDVDINQTAQEYEGKLANSTYDEQEGFMEGVVGGIAFITFTAVYIPYGLGWLFTLFGIVMLMINIYLLYTYVKEMIPFL